MDNLEIKAFYNRAVAIYKAIKSLMEKHNVAELNRISPWSQLRNYATGNDLYAPRVVRDNILIYMGNNEGLNYLWALATGQSALDDLVAGDLREAMMQVDKESDIEVAVVVDAVWRDFEDLIPPELMSISAYDRKYLNIVAVKKIDKEIHVLLRNKSPIVLEFSFLGSLISPGEHIAVDGEYAYWKPREGRLLPNVIRLKLWNKDKV